MFKVQIPYLYKPNIACKLKEKKRKLYASLSGANPYSQTVLLPLNECNKSQLRIQNNLFKRAIRFHVHTVLCILHTQFKTER